MRELGVDELYVLARQVLLDALEALRDHRQSIVVVGAQAIYLQVSDAEMAVAPFTLDGDLLLNPATLAELPPLETALRDAGFHPKQTDSVGTWQPYDASGQAKKAEVWIDLLVPSSFSKGRRAARLIGHDMRAARMVSGLEGALVDLDNMMLGSLSEHDLRQIEVKVAGPAALLIAKLIKIDDRIGTGRHSDKDALDIARVLRGIDTNSLCERMNRVLEDPRSAEIAKQAVELLARSFGRRSGTGIEMVTRATEGLVNADEIALSCVLLAGDLLDALNN